MIIKRFSSIYEIKDSLKVKTALGQFIITGHHLIQPLGHSRHAVNFPWMDEWLEGWVDGWVSEWIDGG